MYRYSFLALIGLIIARAPGLAETIAEPAPSITLTATFATPTDVDLSWKDTASDAQGYIVEWTNDPALDYVVLAYLGPDHRTYRHPRLVAESPQHYRVRAFHGAATAPVEVKLPDTLLDKEYIQRMEGAEDFSWAEPEKADQPSPIRRVSLRDTQTFVQATPGKLQAQLMPVTVSGFKVSWVDQSNDEEGFFLEIKLADQPAYEVVAVIQPDFTAIGYALAPPHRNALVRVRAYYYGLPSNRVQITTGKSATD
jgi:hypothetical protein